MARLNQPGIRRIVIGLATVFFAWAAPPPLSAQVVPVPLGPEAPILTPADSLALRINVPERLHFSSNELNRANRLWKEGRFLDAQWAAERLLASLHDLRQKAPLSYAQNQEFIRLVQQAGSVRLRCVKHHLSMRPSLDEGSGDVAATSASPAASDRDAAGSEPTAVAARAEASLDGSPADSVLASAAGQEILPEDNARVEKWINFFTGRGRSTFAAWLTRSGEYTGMMVPVLERNGLPADLIHLVFVESGFNPKAFSTSSASGPWQFVKSTAEIFGLNVTPHVDERRDPRRSTEAAAQYLKHLYALFHSWPLALAAYNSGEGTILRAVSRQNTFDYWSLKLPQQTEDYVPEFMAALTIAKDPDAYGFEGVAPKPPLSFDEIVIPGAVNLKVLAYLTKTPLELLKKLNPEILRRQASSKDGAMRVRLPKGTGESCLKQLQSKAYPRDLARAGSADPGMAPRHVTGELKPVHSPSHSPTHSASRTHGRRHHHNRRHGAHRRHATR